MRVPQFKVGDRVSVRTTGVVVAGTPGIIHQVAQAVPDAYLVLFDGWAEPCLMSAGDLELIDEPPALEQERTA